MMALRATRAIAAAMLACAPAAFADEMCSASRCDLRIGFADGGSIASRAGATITFGSGGSVVLGEGGSIELGEGGSISPAPDSGEAPDMSEGGVIVLGPGGSIGFGAGASLSTGAAGGVTVASDGALDVSASGPVTLEGGVDVRVGTLRSTGEVRIVAGDDVTLGMGEGLPINLDSSGAAGAISITAEGSVHAGDIVADSATVEAQDDVSADGDSLSHDESASGSGGSITLSSGGTITCTGCGSDVTVIEEGALEAGSITVETTASAGGAWGFSTLLLLACLAGARSRRPA